MKVYRSLNLVLRQTTIVFSHGTEPGAVGHAYVLNRCIRSLVLANARVLVLHRLRIFAIVVGKNVMPLHWPICLELADG